MASTNRHISTLSTPPANVDFAALTPVQAQVVRSLASGRSVSAAAREAELHRSTVHNWLKDNLVFAEAVNQAREDYRNELSDELLDLSGTALHTLRNLLSDPETPSAVRLRAALAVLQRPASPESTWKLPASIDSEQNKPTAAPGPDAVQFPIPRSAPCSCGSGLKYKRCCGRNAPPILNV